MQNERAVLPCCPPDVLGDGDLRVRSLTSDDWTLEHQMSQVPDIVEWATLRPDLSVEQAKERVGRAAQWRRDAAGHLRDRARRPPRRDRGADRT